MRHTGSSIIGNVPWGTHFCQFYRDEQDLIDLLVPYFQAGLKHNEYCMWVTSEPLGVEAAKAALAREVQGLDKYFDSGQIEVLDYSEWYRAGGAFDSQRVLQGWVDKAEAAKSRGFDGLRLTGNTSWLREQDWADFTEYEAAIDAVLGRYPMLALCSYSLEQCGAAEVADVVSNHAFALMKRSGRWEVIESAERRRMQKSLRVSEERLGAATLAAETGDWLWPLGSSELIVSGNWRRLFGVAEGTAVTLERWGQRVHADDRERAEREFKSACEERREFTLEYRVVRADGTMRWLMDRGRASHDGRGRVCGMAGVCLDVTPGKLAEEALVEQREWLRVTLTSIGDAVMATDTEGRITFLNPVAAGMTGWAEEEALGRPAGEVFRIINEDTREEAADIVERVLREGRVLELANHTAVVARDGSEIPIEDSAAPIRDSSGNVAGVVVVFHDVTEKRRAQEALRLSEQRVRMKLDSILSPEGDIGKLELGDIIDVRAVQAMMEDFYELAQFPMAMIDLRGEVLVGVGWQEICKKFHRVHPETCRHCIESDLELSAGVKPGECLLYKCKNHLWDIATPIVIGNQHVGNLFSGQFFLDDEHVDVELFRAQARQYGFEEKAYLAALAAVPRLSKAAVDTGMAFLMKLGNKHSLLSYSNIKLARSVSQRDALMESLKESGERLNRAQEIAHVGSWELDLVNNRLTWSDEVYRIFGLLPQEFDATYEAFLAAVHPEDRAAVDAAYSGSVEHGATAYEITHRVVRKETGETRWVHEKCRHSVDESGKLTRSVGMVQDITERMHVEEQLRNAQKMESIGLLAGGIAHDFNNLLVGVIGNASLAEEMLPSKSPAVDSLRRIIEAGEQAAHLTRQLLAYAGKGRFVLEPVDLSELVEQTSALLQSSLSKKIAIQLDLGQGLPSVESDPGQMRQVIMNLTLNAGEAIGGYSGGIRLSTGEMNIDQRYILGELSGWTVEPGRYVFLEVSDTGCGMDAATRAKIFDPFYTTKFQGRGLGLAAVAGIVRSHKGAIEVESSPGAGARFRVLLPAMATGVQSSGSAAQHEGDLRGKGTVLVVDDEEIVRTLAKRSLELHGYEVLTAEDGPAAIEVVRTEGARIRLVLLDLSMPGMSGEETLPHLRKLKPELEVIVSSGYSEVEALRMFRGVRVSGFIQKPYTVRDLAREVKLALS